MSERDMGVICLMALALTLCFAGMRMAALAAAQSMRADLAEAWADILERTLDAERALRASPERPAATPEG